MKKNLLIFVFTFATIAFTNTSIFACYSYGNNSPACYEYYESDAVFVGKVKDIDDKLKVTFVIEESFLGVETDEIEVFDTFVCGFGAFMVGEKYLVYAKKNKLSNSILSIPKEALWVTGTSKIIEFPKAEKDVEELREFFKKTDASIYGWANIYNRKNLLKTKVTISGNNQTYEVESDRSGKFDLGNLPLGKYIVKADIPKGYKDNYDEQPKREFLIELRRGECARVYFSAKKKKNFWF